MSILNSKPFEENFSFDLTMNNFRKSRAKPTKKFFDSGSDGQQAKLKSGFQSEGSLQSAKQNKILKSFISNYFKKKYSLLEKKMKQSKSLKMTRRSRRFQTEFYPTEMP